MKPPRKRSGGLSGVRVLLTGASSGIGWETALCLSQAGARIAVGARRYDRLKKLSTKLAPAETYAFALDVTDRASCERFVKNSARKLGGVDVLINNAGVGQWLSMQETEPEHFDRILKTNVYGPYWLIRAALPFLADGRRPAIVQVGSELAHRALSNMAAYSASKAFLLRFSEAILVELAPSKIDVVVVSPGIVDTEFPRSAMRSKGAQEKNRPPGAHPQTVARAICEAITARKRPREIFTQPREHCVCGALSAHSGHLRPRARYGS